MNVANAITLMRLVLVPVVVLAIGSDSYAIAFWLFVLAGVSDALDGVIAKRFGQATELGAYLDPVADKALLVSIYVALSLEAHIPLWLVLLVVSRDVFIVAGVMIAWMMDRQMPIDPLAVSKANTAAQIVLAGLVLAELGLAVDAGGMRTIMVYAVAGLTVASAAAYMIAWMRHMAEFPNGDDRA